jgi:hypothetical protein
MGGFFNFGMLQGMFIAIDRLELALSLNVMFCRIFFTTLFEN